MTQAICDITTDEVNVDVVVEPQADTMVEVANRAAGMEQVFHDNTLIGNGNSIDLGVNTDLIATKEYVDEKVESIDTYTKDQIDGKLTAVDAQIDANADAIQKTREDYIQADSEIHQILNNHAENLTTLHNDVDDLGDQVAEIESKIPESASATNPLVTKDELANIDLDGYVKKSGDTMTGDLVMSSDEFNTKAKLTTQGATGRTTLRVSAVDNESVSASFEFDYAGGLVVRRAGYDGGYIGSKDVPIKFVYAKYLNSADGDNPLGDRERDLIVPSEGGTLARIEDLIDLRADINEADSELQTQITAQAAEIATKQDQLTAGDNIIISGNIISATGAGGGAGFDIVVVQELPATGQKGIIYLLAKDGAAPDVYDEYVWITATQTFELIGTTAVDLSGYLPTTGGTGDGKYVFKRLLDSAYTVGEAIVFAPYTTRRELTKISIKVGDGYMQIGTNDYITFNPGSRYLRPDTNDRWKLGYSGYSWQNVYTKKLNNGADIAIPTTGGTLVLAEDIAESVTTKDLTVGTDEGTINIGVVAGTATIATNNGLDIVAQTKFDTAPTTDDNTTYADALDTSLVRKAQVAYAIGEMGSNVMGAVETDYVKRGDAEETFVARVQGADKAGKVLMVDESGAVVAGTAPAGGTKVIFREWE